MMRLFTYSIITVIIISALSCSKGELPEEHFFGKVGVTLVNLPNTPNVDLYFDGKKINSIQPSNTTVSVVLPAGRSGKLAFYKANTDSLIVDSLITVMPNAATNLKLAYSEGIGLKGFITSTPVSPDSLAMQIFETLSDTYFPYEKLDLHIIYVDNQTGNLEETGFVLKGLTKGSLYPQTIVLPLNDASGQPITYGGRFENSATGAPVTQPDGVTDIFALPVDPGKFYLLNIHDDPSGNFYPEVINL